MDSNSIKKLTPEIAEIVALMESSAATAAELILGKLGDQAALSSWRKDDDTVVTAADLAAQELLVKLLQGSFSLVCEEDPSSHALVDTKDEYLLIDPLDGTATARRFGAMQGGQVGFGPIIGLVRKGRLEASVFVNIPQRRGYRAVKGFGVESFAMKNHNHKAERFRLEPVHPVPIEKSALLFYAGQNGELDVLATLRKKCALENYYRFGGFANDSVRVASNLEQLQLQFSVKAWDLPAALIPAEVGCGVLIDPQAKCVSLDQHKPRLENPLLVGQPHLLDIILPLVKDSKR